MSPSPRKTGWKAAGAVIALLAGVGVNVLLLWMLAVWNEPQHFDPPIEPPARLIFTVDPAPPPQAAKPPEPEPDEPPPVMEVNLDFEPEPPEVEPLDLQLDLSVPSVDAVFVPVQSVVMKPQPAAPRAQPQARPAPSAPTSREPLDADRVDQPPRELTDLQPSYPRLAERLRRTGSVQIRVLIDETGRVDDVQVLSVDGHASFEDAVLDVVRRWRFDPARDRGRPVPVWATKTVRFELDT